MIRVQPVTELMHDNTVEHLRRRCHEQAVEIQIALRSTAPPARFLIADRDAPVADANLLRKILHSHRNHCGCALCHIADILRRKGRKRRKCPVLRKALLHMLLDARRFLRKKAHDLLLRHALRCTDRHAAVRQNLRGKRTPAAADQIDFG